MDSRVEKMAQTLVEYSVAVRQGDRVLINGSALAEPLLKAVYIKVLQAGGHPLMIPVLPNMDELFFQYASEEQLKHVPEPVELIMQTYDVHISILAESNTKALSNVNPYKVMLQQQARTELMRTLMKRSAAGELRWTTTIFPANAFAQDAEMSLGEYEDFVYSACMPDMNDPVKYWKDFSVRQQKIVNWFKGKKNIHVKGPETDLYLNIEGRKFINCDGHYNMPDGEIFTAPVENGIEGYVCFSYPAIYKGREVNGVRLWFEQGKVIKATAEKGEDLLRQILNTDTGSCFIGEFAIGTNEGITRFTREILFDEKISGSFHMALGAGYPETGGKNESAIHWDMICDLRKGGEIRVDGELLYKNGRFAIDF